MDLLEIACLAAAKDWTEKSTIAYRALELLGLPEGKRVVAEREALKAIDRLVGAKFMRRLGLGAYLVEDAGREALKEQEKALGSLLESIRYSLNLRKT